MPSKKETPTASASSVGFNRLSSSIKKLDGEIGFTLSGWGKIKEDKRIRQNRERVKKEKKRTGWSIVLAGGTLDLGLLFMFHRDKKPIQLIREIEVYRVIISLNPIAAAGQEFMVSLENMPFEIKPKRASHHDSSGNLVDIDYIGTRPPKLKLDSGGVEDEPLTSLRGYDKKVGAAFLDGQMFQQVWMARKLAPEGKNMELFFSGAEINHGEMAGPYNQHVRFREAPTSEIDPSISFTLKAEPLYLSKSLSTMYNSDDMTKSMASEDGEVMLPGLFVLDGCKIYWRISAKWGATVNKALEGEKMQTKKEIYPKFMKSLTLMNLRKLIENKGSFTF